MYQPTQDQILARVWEIYLNACVCHLDHGSSCSCEAADRAASLLEDVLGPSWHTICRTTYS